MWLNKTDNILCIIPVSILLKGGLYSKMYFLIPLGGIK